MGVVYEAEQLSLGRRVALKVLPFAAMLDRQQLVRFKNEARAAATLDHPHIVAIYSVGCERSVHYYAMQLIEGRSLAEVIAHLKSVPKAGQAQVSPPTSQDVSVPTDTAKAALPTVRVEGGAALSTIPPVKSHDFYRNVARLGIQAAEALGYAHQNGILHRDIKPANLLVDDTGKLWITDFGLARIEADVGMTMTGDVLGTLRYMSPEQAVADRVLIDHRCDIYSLGATLYELLTLQPAFADTDRTKLLQRIADEEPRRPRTIDERIPVDVETVVLKSMAKQRDERYHTTEQFADDLRAFLEGRPIKARAAGLMHRAAKWSRRHQRLVSTVAVAFALLSAILAVSMVRVRSAKTQAMAALEETADLLYTSDMALAYEAFEKGWSDESQVFLDRHRPTGGESDRRGFEWQLLQKLVRQPSAKALADHEGAVNELAVFPDQRKLASVGNDGTLRLWDITTGKLERTISICDEQLHSVAISPDGQYVAVGSTVVYLCNLAQGNQATELFRSDFTVESLAFSLDGKHIALGTRYDEVCLITPEGQVEKRLICTSRNESLEFVPGSRLLLLPNRRMTANQGKLGIAQLWREDLSAMEREFDGTRDDVLGSITVARLSPCGNFVVAGEERYSSARLFDIHSSRVIAATPVSRDWLMDLAYSPDGRSIAIAYRNGQVEVFIVSTMGLKPSPSGESFRFIY